MNDYLKLEKHHKVREHSPVGKFLYRDYEILLSDGGPYTDVRKVHEYPNGWYESSYTIFFAGRPLFESWVEFDGFHDLVMTPEGRKLARVNAARNVAIRVIDDWEKHGFRIDPESIRARAH